MPLALGPPPGYATAGVTINSRAAANLGGRQARMIDDSATDVIRRADDGDLDAAMVGG